MLTFDSARVRRAIRPLSPIACKALRATFSSAWIDLMPIQHRVGQARIVVALDDHRVARFGAQQVIDVLADLVDVDVHLLGCACWDPPWNPPAR